MLMLMVETLRQQGTMDEISLLRLYIDELLLNACRKWYGVFCGEHLTSED